MLNNPDGWVLFSAEQSIYHMNGIDGEYNLKFVSEDGKYEAVYNKDGVLLTEDNDSLNMSTYNYGPPVKWNDGYVEHFVIDIVPYYIYGGTPDEAASSEDNMKKYNDNSDAIEYRQQIEERLNGE